MADEEVLQNFVARIREQILARDGRREHRGGKCRGKVTVDFDVAYPEHRPPEKAPMTNDQLAKELHELKRRRETPLPLIEMFDELLSLAPGLSAKQKRKRSLEIMATALKRLERKDA